MVLQFLEPTADIYEGQFGTFTVDKADRIGVSIYRASLMIAAIALGIGTITVLLKHPPLSTALQTLDWLYWTFCLALGVSLWNIHIYLAPLHRALQAFWLVGCLGSLWIAVQNHTSLVANLYQDPRALVLGGWVFVALTGIYFKEAFCFNRFETKILTFVLPILLGGHWLGILPQSIEKAGILLWAGLMAVFAVRKLMQPIPPDLGDKSVFEYLHKKNLESSVD